MWIIPCATVWVVVFLCVCGRDGQLKVQKRGGKLGFEGEM